MRWSGTGSNSWTNEPTDRTAGACSQIDARGSSWAPLFVHLLLHPLYSLLTLLILPHYTLRSRIEIKGVLLRLLSRCLRCSCCFYRCFLRFPPTLYLNPIFPPVFSPFVSYLYLTFLLRSLPFSFSFNRFSITISGRPHRSLFDGVRRSIHVAMPMSERSTRFSFEFAFLVPRDGNIVAHLLGAPCNFTHIRRYKERVEQASQRLRDRNNLGYDTVKRARNSLFRNA